jgi:hypothetical protein
MHPAPEINDITNIYVGFIVSKFDALMVNW